MVQYIGDGDVGASSAALNSSPRRASSSFMDDVTSSPVVRGPLERRSTVANTPHFEALVLNMLTQPPLGAGGAFLAQMFERFNDGALKKALRVKVFASTVNSRSSVAQRMLLGAGASRQLVRDTVLPALHAIASRGTFSPVRSSTGDARSS